MAKLIFDGLTKKQAEHLAHWFVGQGEQDCYEWLAEEGVKSPMGDVQRVGGCIKTSGDDTILYCRTP